MLLSWWWYLGTGALQVKDDVKFDLTKLAAGEMFCVNCPLAILHHSHCCFCQGFQESFLAGNFNIETDDEVQGGSPYQGKGKIG